MASFLQTEHWQGVLIVTVGYMTYYGFSNIPPVTLAVVFIQMLSFAGIIPDPWKCAGKPIPMETLLEHKNLWSALALNLERRAHGFLFPIIIGSFIHIGAYLEPIYKSANFAMLLGVIALGCGVLYIIGVFICRLVVDIRSTVGLTAVLFVLYMMMVAEENYSYDMLLLHVFVLYVLSTVFCIFVNKYSFFFLFGGHVIGDLYICIDPIGMFIDSIISAISGQAIINFRRRFQLREIIFHPTNVY